jgi:hypothetical protein
VSDKLNVRRIDILSDIREDTSAIISDASLLEILPPPPPVQDIPCPPGMVCFEDYSENQDGLDSFFSALDSVSQTPVRIAFFGDSYIEGDIFCADLRSNLQSKYGGKGVGLAPPTSPIASFRKTVKHSFSGWNTRSLTDAKEYSTIGISGYCFHPDKDAWVRYSGVKIPHLEYIEQVSILYRLSEGEVPISYSINNEKESTTVNLTPSDRVAKYDVTADSIGTIRFDFPSDNHALCVFGISLQDRTGMIVDNFSLRSAPGTTLKLLPEDMLKQTDSLLNYRLIILQYGLNVMTANRKNYSSYQKGMQETVEYLKKCFPQSSILLLSIGDRSMRKDGEYVTMPGVSAMVSTQQTVCDNTGVVFWNLFEAMGGSGSMVEMVNTQPPRANKDYTHLNFEGGKYLGEILFNTIVFEKTRYDKLRKNRRPHDDSKFYEAQQQIQNDSNKITNDTITNDIELCE